MIPIRLTIQGLYSYQEYNGKIYVTYFQRYSILIFVNCTTIA